MNKKSIIIAVILAVGGIVGFNYYQKIFAKNVVKDGVIFIKSDDDIYEVKRAVTPFIKNINDFDFVVQKKNYNKPKGGKYILKEGMSNNTIVNLLRSGNQTPVKVSFNNQDTLEKLAGRIAAQIEPDSISLLTIMKDATFLAENKFTKTAVLGMYLPNSYEFYWNTSAENFRNKMLREYNRFWNEDRLDKAKKLNLSKEQVIALASIVQKETARISERPIVAGLYLNRYKKGWPLQADPTIIYMLKQQYGQDFVVKRVLTKDLEIKSPYNTYLNKGLPPTLIAMPDISSIDAVLNPSAHDYFFMCASVDKIGYHEFAKTLAQHNRNATKYQRWADLQGINR